MSQLRRLPSPSHDDLKPLSGGCRYSRHHIRNGARPGALGGQGWLRHSAKGPKWARGVHLQYTTTWPNVYDASTSTNRHRPISVRERS